MPGARMNVNDVTGQVFHPLTDTPEFYAKRNFYSTKLIGMEKLTSDSGNPDSYYEQNTIYAETALLNGAPAAAADGGADPTFSNKILESDLDLFDIPFNF